MPRANLVFAFGVLIGGEICCKCKRNPGQVARKGPCSPMSTLSYFWLPFQSVLVLSLKSCGSANTEVSFKKSTCKGRLQSLVLMESCSRGSTTTCIHTFTHSHSRLLVCSGRYAFCFIRAVFEGVMSAENSGISFKTNPRWTFSS